MKFIGFLCKKNSYKYYTHNLHNHIYRQKLIIYSVIAYLKLNFHYSKVFLVRKLPSKCTRLI